MNDKFYPFIPGHEFVGRIEEMGPDFPRVDVEGRPLATGDRVAVCVEDMDSTPCGKCYYCATGFPVFCANKESRDTRFSRRAGRGVGPSFVILQE